MNKTYVAIDLKSFYASVECVARKLDPLTTNLVVADKTRTEKTICLAVTPSLKAYGIPGRARLFEVISAVKEINRKRYADALNMGVLPKDKNGKPHFSSSSFDSETLAADPAAELEYIVAPPRMKLYEEVSTKIFSIYMRYVSAEDIHIYSIDECFIDVTGYLNTYHMTPHELTMAMIREVLYETGITATAGIGTNLYLAKIAMDIVAKHVPADKDGVRIAELDEQTYRELLWCHEPLTDFWNVGSGTADRVRKLGCYTMGDIARLSIHDENALYKALGVRAELLIDHAWGYEPTDIATIKAYRPRTASLSSGQVLKEPYKAEDGKLIVKEMAEALTLDLVRKRVVTKKLTLTVGYDKTSLQSLCRDRSSTGGLYKVTLTGKIYEGRVKKDSYGSIVPYHAHGTANTDRWTSSSRVIVNKMAELYDRIVDRDLLIRRINICACDLIPETGIPAEAPVQLDFFGDCNKTEDDRIADMEKEKREHKLQEAKLCLQDRYGKNAVLKGMDLLSKATATERNGQIGGHRAGEDDKNDK